MAQRKQYPAILLLVSLVTVPFLVVAVLLLQYRVSIHEGYQRMLDDVRLFRIYEGTTQIQQIVIARELARQAAQS